MSCFDHISTISLLAFSTCLAAPEDIITDVRMDWT
jgi:hypothetical protein